MMRPLAVFVVALLFLPVAAPVLPAGEAPGESPDIEEITRQVRDRAKQRIRKIDQQRLEEMRSFLAVESDAHWKKLSPRIHRVVQFQRLDRRLLSGGVSQLSIPVSVPLLDQEELVAQMELWSPDVSTDRLKELASARASLASLFRTKEASEGDFAAAIGQWGSARDALKRDLAQAVAELRETASPREEAGLTLLGILP